MRTSDVDGSTPEDRFNAYVHARTGALSRTAYLLTGDHQLAEDLVQTTLFKAAKAWHRIQGDPDPSPSSRSRRTATGRPAARPTRTCGWCCGGPSPS